MVQHLLLITRLALVPVHVRRPQPRAAAADTKLLAHSNVTVGSVGDALGVEVAGPDDVLVASGVVQQGAGGEGDGKEKGAAVVGGVRPVAVARREGMGLVHVMARDVCRSDKRGDCCPMPNEMGPRRAAGFGIQH